MKREFKWPTIYGMTCDRGIGLGRIIFQYDPDATWHSVCDTHGVHIEGKYVEGYGSFHSDSDTIVYGSGGGGISHGDIITHDSKSCSKGLEEARR
jgi:hypothetical protein